MCVESAKLLIPSQALAGKKTRGRLNCSPALDYKTSNRRPGPGIVPRGRGYSVFARADGPAGPRLRPGRGRAISLSFGRGRVSVNARHSWPGQRSQRLRYRQLRGMGRPTPKPVVVPVVVGVVVVAVGAPGVGRIVVEGPATLHPGAFSGPPHHPRGGWQGSCRSNCRFGQAARPKTFFCQPPSNLPISTTIRETCSYWPMLKKRSSWLNRR